VVTSRRTNCLIRGTACFWRKILYFLPKRGWLDKTLYLSWRLNKANVFIYLQTTSWRRRDDKAQMFMACKPLHTKPEENRTREDNIQGLWWLGSFTLWPFLLVIYLTTLSLLHRLNHPLVRRSVHNEVKYGQTRLSYRLRHYFRIFRKNWGKLRNLVRLIGCR